jgi:hypothetical protein
MPDRITQRDLEQLCRVVNNAVNGSPDGEVWIRTPDGDLHARIGAFYIDGAYGGVALYRVVTEGGGVSDVFGCGHVPKRNLYDRLQAFLRGMEVATD